LRGTKRRARKAKETMMDARKSHESRNRLATGIRVAAVAIVVGTVATLWHPAHTNTAAGISNVTHPAPAAAAAPDMSVYLPDRFPAPQGALEELPPQF
jgi:hypothetical protein